MTKNCQVSSASSVSSSSISSRKITDFLGILKIICKFAPANSRRTDVRKMSEWLLGGSTTFWKCVCRSAVFDRWNLGTSDVYVKDNAEVDATGRYNFTFPVWCAEGLKPSRTPFGNILFTNGVGVIFCSVHIHRFPKASTVNRQKPDTPLFFL